MRILNTGWGSGRDALALSLGAAGEATRTLATSFKASQVGLLAEDSGTRVQGSQSTQVFPPQDFAAVLVPAAP